MKAVLKTYICPADERGGIVVEATFEPGHVEPEETEIRIARHLLRSREVTLIDFKGGSVLQVCGLDTWNADKVEAFVARGLQELGYEITIQSRETLDVGAYNARFE